VAGAALPLASAYPSLKVSVQASPQPKASQTPPRSTSRLARAQASPSATPDLAKAKALLETEWKAKESALAGEKQRIQYEIANSTGATREQWKYKLVAGAPTASAPLARKGKMFISRGHALDRALRVPDQAAGSLGGKGDLRPANFAKTAVVTENILVAANDGAHDKRIISVADLRNRIWDDVCFLGHVTKRKRSFLS
jgi:hypothetical protein